MLKAPRSLVSLCQSPAGMDPELEHGAQGRAVSWEWGRAMAVSNAHIREEPAGAGHSFSYLALQEAALELVSSGEW